MHPLDDLEIVDCPEPDCPYPAEVVDRFDLDQGPDRPPLHHLSTACMDRHHRVQVL